MDESELNALSERIIGAAFRVSNHLGCGFLEKVYENSLAIELRKNGLEVATQVTTTIYYDGQVVGEFQMDMIVNGVVIVEVKAVQQHHEVFTAQCINYLKATQKPLCLLINFGSSKVDVRRFKN